MVRSELPNNRDALLARATFDAAAFSLLCNIYYQDIFNYIIARLCSRQIALDVTSATFIFASQNASGFGGNSRGEFLNWLYSIALERVDSYLKRKGSKENLSAAISEAASFSKDKSLEPVYLSVLYDAILQLSSRQQSIVSLRFFERLSPPQIAEIIHGRADIVRTEIAEILVKLKQLVAEKLPFDCRDFFESQQKFEELIGKFSIDKEPDVGHKERLRLKIILSFNKPEKKKHVAIWLAVLIAVAAAGFLTFYFSMGQFLPEHGGPVVLPDVAAVNQPVWQEEKSRLEKIKALAAEENTAELLNILETGELPARLLAAKFLAEILGANAADFFEIAALSTQANQLPNEAAAVVFEEKVPVDVNFEAAGTIEIGGIVQDSQFVPVEDAQVNIRCYYQPGANRAAVDINESFFTDVNGVWMCDVFPEDAQAAEMRIFHPDYVRQNNYQPAVLERLKEFSYLTIIEQGISVAGRVVDGQNKPLPAVVNIGLNPGSNVVNCSAEGEFIFDNVSAGTELFTVQYPGAAPHIEQVEVGPNTLPFLFVLDEPNTIRARVIDVNGGPLEGVLVTVDSWKGFSSLDFNAQTDANGFFEWTAAPADEVFFRFSMPGYLTIEDFGIESSNDYVITLLPQE